MHLALRLPTTARLYPVVQAADAGPTSTLTARLNRRIASYRRRVAEGSRIALLLAWAVATHAPSALSSETVIDLASYPDAFRIQANAIGDSFSAFLDSCDINGDGIQDLLVSASEAAGPADSRPLGGEAYIVYGARKRWSGTTTIGPIHNAIVYGRLAGDNFASHVVCGDTNGDRFDDLIVGAYSADSASGQRVDSGQVHLILGGPNLPAVIDLASAPHTTIWGAAAGYTSGRVLAVGDLNGDGLADIVINARNAPGSGGAPANTGRAYVVFGRASWPATIDLASQASVVVYGAEANDRISSSLVVADLDRDGTSELLVGASAASGPPSDGRAAAGDINVFRGRAVWPPTIDLKFSSPDTLIYGADPFDGYGGARAVRVGDLDADGSADVLLGAPGADGVSNTALSTGEGRVAEFGAALPPLVDLRAESRLTVYGVRTEDRYGNGVEAADVNGDGIEDLWIDAVPADGPGDARLDAGEARILFGGSGLPAVHDLGVTPADMVIYGGEIQDTLASKHGIDLNDDGLAEITVTTSLSNLIRLTSLWLLSPFDTDGDGFSQLVDNCPLLANPSQNDVDVDGRGDACSLDWDGDLVPDTTDCAPADVRGGPPGLASDLRFVDSSFSTLEWATAPFADQYQISRGSITGFASGDYGVCRTASDPDPTDTRFEDAEAPEPGAGFSYLVRGFNDVCKLAGSWGTTSASLERVNTNPERCP
jgi:hypothetical protein